MKTECVSRVDAVRIVYIMKSNRAHPVSPDRCNPADERERSDYLVFYNEECTHYPVCSRLHADLYFRMESPLQNRNSIHLKFASNWS